MFQDELCQPGQHDTQSKSLHRSFDWVSRVMRLARTLNKDLSKTLDAYQTFSKKHASIFETGHDSGSMKASLSTIETSFSELKQLKATLDYIADHGRILSSQVCYTDTCP